ncbi:DNA methyltransferase [Micromonospora haikouensis]|uniref:DNA methyltransferase n=1 Tax=Micromonospora haikouensis TaxID=686309 RepID=UPI003421D8D3
MKTTYADGAVELHHGDCLNVLRAIPDQSVDAVVCDPPYGLADHHPRVIAAALAAWLGGDREHVSDGRGFMGRDWDRFVPPPAVWDECWRVLKPGGHLLAFAAPRTADLMSMSIRLAGFEIRDSINWVYASGMPKGQDISKVIDRMRDDRTDVLRVTAWLNTARIAAGFTHKQIDAVFGFNGMASHWTSVQGKAAIVPTWDQWERLRGLLGFGADMDGQVRALNARKGSVGDNWQAREVVGTARRVRRQSAVNLAPISDGDYPVTAAASEDARRWEGWNTTLRPAHEPIVMARKSTGFNTIAANVLEHGTGALNVDGCRAEGGRWPANIVLAHAPLYDAGGVVVGDACAGGCVSGCPVVCLAEQSAGTSRFFPVFRYESKASSAERPRSLDGTQHVSVKPLGLMRWLVRLVTQPGGLVVDPFAGSGTTAEACVLEGFRCVAVEREASYLPLIEARLSKPLQPTLNLFGGAA